MCFFIKMPGKKANKHKSTKDKKIMKNRLQSTELKTENTQKNQKTESCFFKIIDKIDKLLARLTKKREKRYKLSISRREVT